MKKYIIITPDGFCEDMNNDESAHCQVIGTYRAKNKENAIKQARKSLKEWNLEYEDLIAYELHPDEKL